MGTKKVLTWVFSLLFAVAFIFVLCWGIINFNKVKDGMSGSGVYTQKDLNNAYQDGYETALTNKEEYEILINGYRDKITTLNDTISQLNSQIGTLTNNNKDYQNEITRLNGVIETNQNTITNLESIIDNNNSTINDLNNQITNYTQQISSLNADILTLEEDVDLLTLQKENLESQIESKNDEIASLNSNLDDYRTLVSQLNEEIVGLENDLEIASNTIVSLRNELTLKTNQIISLQNQVNSLQTSVYQLNATNETNLRTISTLNSQIESLNTQISDLQYQVNNNNSNVSTLNNKIAQLEETVAYYEQYVASMENGTQVVVTFEFDGSVYNIQVVNANSTVAVNDPTSTQYVQFNYWTINNQEIDLSTQVFTENTKVIANVTHFYNVFFKVDGSNHETQIIEENTHATMPTTPLKTGYTFLGWSIDGANVVDISTITIESDTTFTAVFNKQFTVQFVSEDTTISTQSIDNGAYATAPSVENTTYKVFNGWKVNGTLVDVASYRITSDLIFIADYTYKYDVSFMVDDVEYDSQVVMAGTYATLPSNPTKDECSFIGWSLDGETVIDLSTYVINNDTVFIAVFTLPAGLYETGTRNLIYTYSALQSNNYVRTGSRAGIGSSSNAATKLAGDLVLPSSVTSLGTSAFGGAVNLTGIYIPASVTSISTYVFDNCSSLTKIEVASDNLIYDSRDNCNAIIETATNILMFGCCETVIPNTVVEIKSCAFYNLTSLTDIIIPSSVKTVNANAFNTCGNLRYVYISSGVENIKVSSSIGYSLPFKNASNDLVIYCQDSKAQSGWNQYWYYTYKTGSMSSYATVLYNKTLEQYLGAIGG